MIKTERITALPQESLIRLRRAFGSSFDDISMENAISFYSIMPDNLSNREEANAFFVVTMYCHYKDNASRGKRFAEAISDYYRISTESGKREVISLMDASYDANGTFLSRLYSMIRKMESQELYVDANDLYQELAYWDARSKQRKIRIAKAIVSFKEDED